MNDKLSPQEVNRLNQGKFTTNLTFLAFITGPSLIMETTNEPATEENTQTQETNELSAENAQPIPKKKKYRKDKRKQKMISRFHY